MSEEQESKKDLSQLIEDMDKMITDFQTAWDNRESRPIIDGLRQSITNTYMQILKTINPILEDED